MSIILPQGYHLLTYNEVSSTNNIAKEMAADSIAHGTVIWAQSQTEGRGRQGRKWISDSGNFYCSLLLNPEGTIEDASQLSFIAALAARDALKEHVKIYFKWPNDLLLNAKKCGGILLETSGNTSLDYVIVGIGINIAHSPNNTEFPATNLHKEYIEIEVKTLLQNYIEQFDYWYKCWQQKYFEPIRESWLISAVGLNEIVHARTANKSYTGLFKGIDAQGTLILEEENSTLRHITAGDVFFEETADAINN